LYSPALVDQYGVLAPSESNPIRIDAHQHFWRYSAEEYPWIQNSWPIRRDYLPVDLEAELAACDLDGCVAVQARQSTEETMWLLSLADASPIIKGVVGWVNLCSAEMDEQLAAFARHPKLVGVRHVVQDEPDDRFMLRKDFQSGISRLRDHDLAYDILVFPRQFPAAIELVRRFPEQRFVLDHLAKPPIRDAVISPWREDLRELARCPNVFCKISGMVTEARWNDWKQEDFRPYLDIALEAFGVNRLMFGSDWPVALLAGSYREVYELARGYFRQLGPESEAQVFGQNAGRFYQL
jgi:L-fuconolactonase